MTAKHPQSAVDKALFHLKDEELAEWNRLCRFNANYSELRNWLAQKGQNVSVQNISTWWIANRPRGREAIAVNLLSEHYLGTDAVGLLQMSAGIAATLIDTLKQLLTDEYLESATIESKLNCSVSLLRELRQAASELYKLETIGDRDTLVMAGGYALGEELKKIFAHSPMLPSLESGIVAALEKMEQSN